ncbi:dienelactone hydrolase family protein [Novosphingobium sp. AP12]|uniref:dienelactone hydrolase family protein n=1 Tax=Novosphingobium sp. AP12 TaxID=1144305 RepID=UPI000271F173|nr:alpha/beta family hydrolase [Novosphingobium sp. AP12]EJL28892.1 dienelactone hydrolase-like enzyme [Novosphingobium sp. AP12]
MRTFATALVAALSLAAVHAHAQDAIRVTTPRGAPVEVIIDKPAGKGPFPAVVLGSGSGYDMRKPILARAAGALVAQGIAVYRIDWAYRVAGTPFAKETRDRKAQVEDMRTVLRLAQKDPDVDPARIALAGKSLGSVVAWKLLRMTPEVKGAILLTPVCDPKEDAEAPAGFYPDIAAESRPRLWVMGDVDPVCPVPVLERYVAAGGRGDRIAIISGDHGYQSPLHPERDARALDLALDLTTDFALTLLAPSAVVR